MTLTPLSYRILQRQTEPADTLVLLLGPADADKVGPVQPGQFFMLSLPGVGEAAFTFVSLPDAQGRFRAVIRETGTLTRALQDWPLESIVGVRGPLGKGWPDIAPQQPVLVIAGGCGLAPLAALLDSRTEVRGRTVLLYGSRTEPVGVLAAARAAWQGQGVDVVHVVDEGPCKTARCLPITAWDARLAVARARVPQQNVAVLLCGPEAMMRVATSELMQQGIPPDHIWVSLERRMHCGIGLCGHCYVGDSYICQDGPVYRADDWLRLCPEVLASAPLHC